jgi:putative aldouronate transport system permease protein
MQYINNKNIKRSFGSRLFDGLNILFLCFIGFITLYPMYYVLVVSISDGFYVNRNMVYWYPMGVNFSVYKSILNYSYFMRAYRNTIIYTVVGTVVNMAMTVLCAYPLSRTELVGRKPLMAFFTFTMFFGGGLIPMYLQVLNLGLIDSMWSLVLPGAISTYNMIVMRTSFQNIPPDLHESAYLDGANDFVVLTRIVLPLSGAVLATITLFYAVGHWNSYFNALIYMNTREKYPLQLVLRNIVIQGSDSDMLNYAGTSTDSASTVVTQNYKYAAIITAVLPILLVYPFVQKFFVKGVMIGSVKG